MAESVSLEQRRSRKAWADAREGCEVGGHEYAELVQGAPARIMGGGLMQALAFYRSRPGKPAGALLEHLCAWLARRPGYAARDFEKVMETLTERRRLEYLEDTSEVLAYLRWLRHFAAAEGERE